jgi:hypothetical protein
MNIVARADRPNVPVITYIVGDTLTMAFGIVDSAGDPVDLTGATLQWAVAKRISISQVGPVLVTKTPDVDGNVATVTLDPGDLRHVGDLAHELKLSTGGITSTVARGWFRSLVGVIAA